MQSVVEALNDIEAEIVAIKSGGLTLDKAKESAKLRKIQVQHHGHMLGAIRTASRLENIAHVDAINQVVGQNYKAKATIEAAKPKGNGGKKK